MTQPRSAGVLLYRHGLSGLEVLLILPGGPYWRRRDQGAWQIPKGAIEAGEAPIEAAVRELHEELGVLLEDAPRSLCAVRQAGGKRVEVFAIELDWDVKALLSNQTTIEWPPKSGRMIDIPEVAEAKWMSLADAERAMLPSQLPVLAALEAMLAGDGAGST